MDFETKIKIINMIIFYAIRYGIKLNDVNFQKEDIEEEGLITMLLLHWLIEEGIEQDYAISKGTGDIPQIFSIQDLREGMQ